MREILFKGKDLQGNWVYGFYHEYKGEHYIVNKEGTEEKCIDVNTLCQYTGLKDKNGNKIFEGDLITGKNKKGINTYTIKYVNHETYSGFKMYGDNKRFHIRLSHSILWNFKGQITGSIHDKNINND